MLTGDVDERGGHGDRPRNANRLREFLRVEQVITEVART
jgi:hypothetical protein